MKILASIGCFLRLSRALRQQNDYDYLDFWDLIAKLEKGTSDSLRMAAYKTANQEEILDVPTRLKKTGDGIKIDIEKTSTDGSSIERKKDKVK